MKPSKITLSFGLDLKAPRAWKRLRIVRLRVLLAEHRRNMRTLLALILRREGHEVVEADDEARLLKKMASTVIAGPPVPLGHCPPGAGRSVLAGLREQRSVGLILHEEGHEVIQANDGAKLLEEMASMVLDGRRVPLDFVISEHCLPGITGMSVLAGLHEQGSATAFILITANADVQANALRLGAVVLDKRFEEPTTKTAARARPKNAAVLSSILIQRSA